MAIAQETFEHLRTAGLADVDPEIADTLGRELERQRGQIELIASENFTWPSVLEAIGSTPTNKYAEGYPGKRYYGGCEVVDEMEELARERAKSLFGAEHANVQPHAGAQANMAVYFAVLQPGDRVLGLSLDHGGHLTHGLKVNFSGKLYEFHHYGVSRETMTVDYDEVLAKAKEVRPKLIVCGGSAYPRTVEADRFREIADEVGAMLMTDMAHFAGPGRGGAASEPGAALALRHLDDAQDARRPARRVRALHRGARAGGRPRALPGDAGRAADAHDRGEGGVLPRRRDRRFPRVPGPGSRQRRHARVGPDRRRLRGAHGRHRHPSRPARPPRDRVDGPRRPGSPRTTCKLTVNRNTVPFDERPPMVASGVRIGTPAATMRGFDEEDFSEVASIIVDALSDDADTDALAARSVALCDRRPLYPGFRGYTTYAT